MTGRLSLRACALALACSALPAHATHFGTVELVTGQVTVQASAGGAATPRVGDRIQAGADIVTGKDGEIHIETADSGFLAVRPNTRLRVTEYRAEGDDLDRQVLSLLRGTFRSVTGWIGRYNTDRYRVNTPTATIGVRGTDHEPSYLLPEDLAGADAEAGLEPGTYDKVNEGATFIENPAGRIDITRDQAGFAHASRARPARLRQIPRFFKGTRHEKRILKRREALRKVVEQRRADRKAKTQERRERAKERREKRKERRDQD